MLNVIVFFSLVFCVIAKNSNKSGSFDYKTYCEAKYSCGTDKNVVCEFKCEAGKDCGQYKEVKLIDAERQFILDLHNYYRNFVAEGRDTRGGNGQASNMNALNYDPELEYLATCWSKQCQVKQEALCKKSKKFKDSGQSVWTIQRTATFNMLDPTLLLHSVRTWYDEIYFMRSSRIQSYHLSLATEDVRHFTQLVWADTTHVGCGRASWVSNDSSVVSHSLQLCCNYGPTGNIPTKSVYEYGTAASNCPKGKYPNKEYKGLCGHIKMLSSTRIPIAAPNRCAVHMLNVILNLMFCLHIVICVY